MSRRSAFSLSAALTMLGAAIVLMGCGIGKDRVLFVTKTSFGVDIDTKPPTLDVSYTRREGTISPGFEDGVLPQMASFASQVALPANIAVGQSIATGTAAVILSRFLSSDVRPERPNSIGANYLDSNDVSKMKGSVKEARPFFFGTDTSFGFRVTFSPETAAVPDSLNLGYKRKELALVGISETTDGNGKEEVNLPSLLATAGLGLDAQSATDTSNTFVQFFATGKAARNLAALPEVRRTIGARVIRDQELADELAKHSETATSQRNLVIEIEKSYESAEAAKKEKILTMARELFGKTADEVKDINDVSDFVDGNKPEDTKKLECLRDYSQRLATEGGE